MVERKLLVFSYLIDTVFLVSHQGVCMTIGESYLARNILMGVVFCKTFIDKVYNLFVSKGFKGFMMLLILVFMLLAGYFGVRCFKIRKTWEGPWPSERATIHYQLFDRYCY